jgi:asparagine synthase (glutamine-hydrolysing)
MCGIAGIFHYRDSSVPVDQHALARMTNAIAHRGPDGEGVFAEGPLGLGNRRLAIVDLRSTGDQPMRTPDGACAITYNGECYNHASFRDQLKNRGVRFRGTSDTETLLHLLSEYGPSALTGLLGIFGLAFWDGRNRRLILARDPLGVKQVYFHDDGRRIVFASEIKAVLECAGVPRELDPQGLNEYLHFHTPLYQRTFFKGIEQLRPGEYIEVTRNGLRRKSYWETDGFQPRSENDQTSVADLRRLIGDVVRDQLMSDVPVGAFFSGGIDSSAVAAFARRAGSPPRCFGVHFTNQGVIDERPFQEAAARALGLELNLITVDGSAFPRDLMRLMYFQDQPVIGPAMIPMYYVSQLASKSVKVCLGGQAADEIFGGYARYALVHPGRVLKSAMPGTRKAGEGRAAPVGGNLLKQLVSRRNLRRAVNVLRPLRGWASRYFENFASVPEATWLQVFDPAVVSRERARQQFNDGIARSPALDPGDRILHWDMQTYLPGLFQQDDRMSMANGLESRVPLADPRMVRFALHTGFDLKLRGGASKWILRQAVADVLPEEVLNRRKVGFDTPAEAWMRGPHQDFVRDLLLSSSARSRGWWTPRGLQFALDNTQSPQWFDVAWKLASIEAWARVFVDGQTPAGVSVPALVTARS